MTTLDAADLAGQSRKLAAARASIAASALLAVAKLAAGLWSGSLALLSEAGHAFVDTGATILTFYAVREAEKPADAEHHYGHGKFEALAALIETGFLFGLALLVVGEAIRRLMEPDVRIDAGWPVYAVLGVSIAIDFVRSRQLETIAQEEHSDALAADALHFASDLVSSVLALAGVAATHFGFLKGDALASFGVAVFIAIAGYRLGKRTISTLLDAAPGDLTPQIRQAIAEVPGVIALDDLRLRSVGPEVIGEAVIGVSRSLKRDMTCSFYVGGYPEEAQAKRAAELLRPGEWNRIRVRVRGRTFTVWLNGEEVSRYTAPEPSAPGPIGLQIHGGLEMQVEFRDVRALAAD